MVAVPAATPVTIPPLTVAIAALLVLHTPPDVASDRVIAEPLQTLVAPDIAGTTGVAFTVIDFVELTEPQVVVTVYLIVAVPAATPVTTPPLTVAIAALLVLHTPPGVASESVIDEPLQTAAAPVIANTVGAALTVIIVLTAVIHPLVFVTV